MDSMLSRNTWNGKSSKGRMFDSLILCFRCECNCSVFVIGSSEHKKVWDCDKTGFCNKLHVYTENASSTIFVILKILHQF